MSHFTLLRRITVSECRHLSQPWELPQQATYTLLVGAMVTRDPQQLCNAVIWSK